MLARVSAADGCYNGSDAFVALLQALFSVHRSIGL